MENKYIHYGHKEFRRNSFQPIKNDPEGFMSKPVGGLWASSVDAACGWKQWCEDNNFRKCSEDNSFTFTLTEDANVLRLKSARDLNALPKRKFSLEEALEVKCPWVLLDFEAIQKRGVDAIEVTMNAGLYFALYGWDCDSILVMNPEVIVRAVEETGDEGRGKVYPKLEDMTRIELCGMLLAQLEKFLKMDVDLVKAAIREVNRREAAEDVDLDATIEAYERRIANREPLSDPGGRERGTDGRWAGHTGANQP